MKRDLAICVVLVAAVCLVHGHAVSFEFLDYDDNYYVTHNRDVAGGLTADGVVAALARSYTSSWFPLAIISHQLDVQLFALRPAGHHLTNVLLHLVNVLLLFALLKQMTAAGWRSAAVAALFAVHPLTVEPVAWVSSRKDVLSTLLMLMTVAAYLRYVGQPSRSGYLLVAVAFVLGLLAKTVLVILPFALLLLDYWPLSRFNRDRYRLIVEKLPLVVLAVAFAAVQYFVQQAGGAVRSMTDIPLHLRIANACVSYVTYVGKLLWPADLSVIYPHPYLPGGTPWAGWHIAGSVALLAVATAGVLKVRRRLPFLAVGWLWFLVMLLPVIGLIPLGVHGLADRYSYTPMIGLYMLLAWALAALPCRSRFHRVALISLATGAITLLGLNAAGQAQHWRDTVTVFTQVLKAAPDPPLAHINLAVALGDRGNREAEISHNIRALEIDPGSHHALFNMANAHQKQGRFDEAMKYYRQGLALHPRSVKAMNNVGVILLRQGRFDEAIKTFERSLGVNRSSPVAHFNLGLAHSVQGTMAKAIHHYRQSLQFRPGDHRAHAILGKIFHKQGDQGAAIYHCSQALYLAQQKKDGPLTRQLEEQLQFYKRAQSDGTSPSPAP